MPAFGLVVRALRGTLGGQPVVHARMAVLGNTHPWTYLGDHPLDPFPGASFEGGLELLAVQRLTPGVVLRSAAAMLRGARPTGPGVTSATDVRAVRVSSDVPFAVDADGEALPARRQVEVRAALDALRVLA